MKRILLGWLGLQCLLLSMAEAERWTVQAGTFEDFRNAQQLVSQLAAMGFESYTEFFMLENRQLVRVRFGCFLDLETAQSYAERARRSLLSEVLPQPMSDHAPVTVCIQQSVGFIPPAEWRLHAATASTVSFWIRLGEVTGFISYAGVWTTQQEQPGPVAESTGVTDESFSQTASGRIFLQNPRVHIASGELLWQSPEAAVILEDSMIIAYRIERRSN